VTYSETGEAEVVENVYKELKAGKAEAKVPNLGMNG
jgi:hypothetical protein